MAENITPFSINAPGYFGLNKQDSPVDLDPRFALEATNCVIDRYGRIGSRKGWTKAHTANTEISTSNVSCIGELVTNAGVRYTVATAGAYLFKHSSTTLTTLTYGGGAVAPTISASNWMFVHLGGVGVFFQRGYDPLIFDPAVSTTTFRRLSEKSGYTGTVPQANCAVSAYGRIWCADTSTDKNTVHWSDLLTTHLWTAGSSGSINLVGVWPQGGDEIVALAAHNNRLVIFGKRQTLIYSGATDPSTMALEDVLDNVGCIARDSVQNTGDDIIFLSDTGVRSLRRTIQENSAPTRTLSKNIFTELQLYINVDSSANIKSGYSPIEGFYLITLPASGITYCFDTKILLEDGAARVTTWNHINPKCFCFLSTRKMYMGQPGYIGEYTGWSDNSTSYRMSYYTTWIDFGNPIQKSILKKVIATLIVSNDQSVIFKWGSDFTQAEYSATELISGVAADSEYGIAEYGIGEYGGATFVHSVQTNACGTGKVLQFGIESEINGKQLSIQKIDIFTKDGRL